MAWACGPGRSSDVVKLACGVGGSVACLWRVVHVCVAAVRGVGFGERELGYRGAGCVARRRRLAAVRRPELGVVRFGG